MKVQLASDLHLEFYETHMPPATVFESCKDRDLLILAGDIGVGLCAKNFVLRELEKSPIVLVPGNHEYYVPNRPYVDASWRRLARVNDGLHYLVMETVEIRGFRIAGTPWYTDFWGDFRLNKYREGLNDFHHGGWTPEKHAEAHKRETDWLLAQAGKTDIVVTHWPPTKEAIHPRFVSYPECLVNPYFVNDKPDVVREIGARYHFAGHIHECFDYMIGGTRCVGNPAGYPSEHRSGWLFDPCYVLDIGERKEI